MVWLFSAVFRVVLPSFLISTPMSDTKSLNTSLLKVMICSKNERSCSRNISDLTLHIIYDAWWASMNVGSKRSIAWNASRHAPSWRFYLHCVIEESGSPGIIWIICNQVLLHPSEHGTSSMGKDLLPNAHIAKLNGLKDSEVTELTSSTVDPTALAILKMQGSRGITLVSLQMNIGFDIECNPYWPKQQTKHSKREAKDIETSEFHQDTWDRYGMLWFVSAHIAWNAISNLELQQSYEGLCDDLVLLSATVVSHICRREYELTVHAIKKQLLVRNKVSIALDGWTSTNKLDIPLVIVYYMDRYRTLHEVQLTFDEVDALIYSRFAS